MTAAHDLPESDAGVHPSTGTSRSLLAQVQADEPAAWERLVNLYAPLVHHWCQGSRLQDSDIADIFQEVFRAVLLHVASFRKERKDDTFRGWLRRITQNKVRDHFRKRDREARGAGGSSAQERLNQVAVPKDGSEVPTPENAWETGLLARALKNIRNDFEERTWLAFWRTAVEGRPPKDVGSDLGLSPGAVRVAKSRVLHRLRDELGDVRE